MSMVTALTQREGLCDPSRRHGQAGFTLMELMVVVVIIGILVAIVVPSYQDNVRHTKRASAEGCLSEYANFMERFYTTNLRYDKDAAGVALVFPTLSCATATADNYTYSLVAAGSTQSSYKLQAVPTGAQANDTKCGTLSLDQTGLRAASGTLGALGCW